MERARESELQTIDEDVAAHRPEHMRPRARRPPRTFIFVLALAIAVVCACSGAGRRTSTNRSGGLAPSVSARPVGPGPAYRPPAVSAVVGRRATIDGLRCLASPGPRFGIHLELFAHRFVVHIPAGIGVAPPQRIRGVYVLGGKCSYPLRTLEPTGVVQVQRGNVLRLGVLFAVWGQRLDARRLLSFRGSVLGFVDGRRWRGPLAEIPLRRHAEIVLEVDGAVAPHPSYDFAPGL